MSPRNIIFLAPLVIFFCYFCVLFFCLCCEIIEGKRKRSVENGTYPIWSSNGYPARYEAIRYAVACANLMPEAEDLIKSFVVLCKDYKLTASIKCNGEEVDAPLIDIFQRGCEAFPSKLGDVAK